MEKMMDHVVVQDFKTDIRVFTAGDDVAPDDITGVMSFDDWKSGGFIAVKGAVKEQPAVAPVRPPRSPAPGED